jgi:hypothetical protein
MANKALDILYNWAKSTGYQKSPDDFYNLISTNKDAFNRVYNYAKETGYERDENAFAGLVGIQMAPPPVEPIRRSEEGAAPTPVAMEGGGAEEQPMPAAPETSVSETVVEKPMSEEKAAALESDLNKKLLPVTEKTVIKEVPAESDKMVIKSPEKRTNFLETADEILYQIYNSPGYLKKLENEIAQSKGSDKETDPKLLDDLKVKQHELIKKVNNVDMGSKEYNTLMDELDQVRKSISETSDANYYIGGKSNAADLINERKKRVQTGKVTLNTDPEAYEYEAGVMSSSFRNEPPWKQKSKTANTYEEYKKIADEEFAKEREFTSKEQPIDTEITIATENKRSKTNEYPAEDYRSDLMATAIDNKEQSANVPLVNPKGGDRDIMENITPYAVDVVKQNIVLDEEENIIQNPIEIIGKKRATEVNLIGRGLLKPGENVDESHFKELLSRPDLPFSITQLLQSVSGISEMDENVGAAETAKILQGKILNDPKLYKETLQRWLNIMNKIAYNDKKSFDANPFKIATG